MIGGGLVVVGCGIDQAPPPPKRRPAYQTALSSLPSLPSLAFIGQLLDSQHNNQQEQEQNQNQNQDNQIPQNSHPHPHPQQDGVHGEEEKVENKVKTPRPVAAVVERPRDAAQRRARALLAAAAGGLRGGAPHMALLLASPRWASSLPPLLEALQGRLALLHCQHRRQPRRSHPQSYPQRSYPHGTRHGTPRHRRRRRRRNDSHDDDDEGEGDDGDDGDDRQQPVLLLHCVGEAVRPLDGALRGHAKNQEATSSGNPASPA